MGIAEDILAELKAIRAALEGGAAPKASGGTTSSKPKDTAKPKGPSLEAVQDKIRALAEQDGMKDRIKDAITKLGGKRAGDFEGDATKLQKLSDALDALANDDSGSGDEDDDLL